MERALFMTKQMYRHIQSLLLFVTTLLLAAAFYFEWVDGLQACPLCMMQRLCLLLFGFCCLMGLCLSTLRRARRFALVQILLMLAAFFFACRQLWLQSLPPDANAVCMPGFEALLHYFSKEQMVKALFWGTADCAEVTWRFLGLSMPAWSALCFLTFFLVSLCVLFGIHRKIVSLES
jgi:disulfide bond formation protein DsbB